MSIEKSVLVFAVVAASGAALAGTWAGQRASTKATAGAEPSQLVVALDSRLEHDAGEIARGGRLEVPFVVSNPGSAAVTVGPIRTSCECFKVELDGTRVEAGSELRGRAVIDLAVQPKFAGGLILDAEAGTEDGKSLFGLRLRVSVK